MKFITYYERGSPKYDNVCDFAKQTYDGKLQMKISRFPDYFSVIEERGNILGCMGLNRKPHNVIFTDDPDVTRWVKNTVNGATVGEQYIWASDRDPRVAMLLVSTLASFAWNIGIHYVIFTGTTLAFRVLKEVGIEPIIFKPISQNILSLEDRRNCARWFSVYRNATICLLPTESADKACARTLFQYSSMFTLDAKLQQLLEGSVILET